MDWIISFGIGCALFIFVVIGIIFFTWLGDRIREGLYILAIPNWVWLLLILLLCIVFYTILIHAAFFGGLA
jgi:sorbitol-specific phosphotransferase system component IIBC